MKATNDYVRALGDLYERMPKAVAAAIAVSALTCGGDNLAEAPALVISEWEILHDNGIVAEAPLMAPARSGELHTVAQLARRAGFSEGRGRALLAAGRLPRPDHEDAGGRPLWRASTIDAWCRRTGRERGGAR